MSGTVTKFFEGLRVVWFRFAGLWFAVWGVLVSLFGVAEVLLSLFGSEQMSAVAGFCWLGLGVLFFLLGRRFMRTTAEELRQQPAWLVTARDRVEKWVDRENKNV